MGLACLPVFQVSIASLSQFFQYLFLPSTEKLTERKRQGKRKQDPARWMEQCMWHYLVPENPGLCVHVCVGVGWRGEGGGVQLPCLSAWSCIFLSSTLTSTGLTMTLNHSCFINFFFQRRRFSLTSKSFLHCFLNIIFIDINTYRLCIVEFTFIQEIPSYPNCTLDLQDAVPVFFLKLHLYL